MMMSTKQTLFASSNWLEKSLKSIFSSSAFQRLKIEKKLNEKKDYETDDFSMLTCNCRFFASIFLQSKSFFAIIYSKYTIFIKNKKTIKTDLIFITRRWIITYCINSQSLYADVSLKRARKNEQRFRTTFNVFWESRCYRDLNDWLITVTCLFYFFNHETSFFYQLSIFISFSITTINAIVKNNSSNFSIFY